jgi:hypothetical protein
MDIVGVERWVVLMVVELVGTKKVDAMAESLALLLALRWVDVMVECWVDL